MESRSSKDELHDLVDAMVDGRADSDAIDQFCRRLESDAAARRTYIEYMCVEAELVSRFHAQPVAASTSLETSSLEASQQQHTGVALGARRWLTQWMAIGACLLITWGGSSWLIYKYTSSRTVQEAINAGGFSAERSESTPGEEAVAQITGTQNCRWWRNGIRCDIGFGDTISAFERLELEAGLVEITFFNGVRVVLEGPASFKVPGNSGIELLTGRMATAVPRDSTDFTVRAPRLTINDSGVQFGLAVTDASETEVHVFEGSLRARAIGLGGHELSSIRLVARESARIGPQAVKFVSFQDSGKRFVRSLALVNGHSDGFLAIEQFDYPVGPLAWQNGGFGWAGPWSDVEIGTEQADIEGASGNGVAEGSLEACGIISQGNRAELVGRYNRVSRTLSTCFCGVFDTAGLIEKQDGARLIGQDGKTVYIGFLQQVSQVNDEFYGFELHRGDGDSNRVLCIGNGGAPGTPVYGVNSTFNMLHRGPASLFAMPLGKEDTETHLFVIRIDFGPENEDLVTIYRDPVSLTEEAKCVAIAKLPGNFAFDRICLGNFLGTKRLDVDEIRIGTDFSAATSGRQKVELSHDQLSRLVPLIDMQSNRKSFAFYRAFDVFNF